MTMLCDFYSLLQYLVISIVSYKYLSNFLTPIRVNIKSFNKFIFICSSTHIINIVIYQIQIGSMYEDGKIRNYYVTKTKGGHSNPLIKDKKVFPEQREKENQKHNVEYYTKGRSLINNTSTHDYQSNKFTDANLHANYSNNYNNNHDRYGGFQPTHTNLPQNPSKGLTFGTVKTNTFYQEQSSILTVNNDIKRPLQINKNNLVLEKEKVVTLTDRVAKPLIDRFADKKEKNSQKPTVVVAKIIPPITQLPLNPQIDDFSCSEELQFKPVQKKSLIPQKKYAAEKTTSKFDFAKPNKKVEKKNDTNLLKQFESLQKIINSSAQAEALALICQKQEEYAVDPGYLEKNHKALSWWSRAILVDWMRHICYQFGLQRDTYHIAVVILDNYLAKSTLIQKSILQAIGATTLFIASKLQEFQCKQSKEFAKSTNNSCSIQDIHEHEIKIVKALRFRLNPPTLFSLANIMMSQWDIFLTTNEYALNHQLFLTKQKVFFKQLDQNSYRMFREMMQLIDCSIIDVQTSQYKPKMLVCSFMYLLIGRQFGIFESKEIVTQFPGSSLYLLDDQNEFNDLYRSFIEYVFGFSLFELLPTVQYCATYFDIAFTYEKPLISEQEDLESMSLEQYCSYQTYNSSLIKIIKNRYRGLY